jgi:hypothetical protein
MESDIFLLPATGRLTILHQEFRTGSSVAASAISIKQRKRKTIFLPGSRSSPGFRMFP